MSSDLIYIVLWWLVFFVIGVVSIPLIWILFKRFFDIGYGFTKTVGLLAISYVAFLGGIFHILPFTKLSLFTIFFFYTLINYLLFKKNQQKIRSDIYKNIKIMAAQEILFTLGLVFWSWVRAHQPDIRGLEKFMDIGFINTILNSRYLPPVDMWFAGESINYYWFGHFVVAVATKLSNIGSSITYNLMIATILGLALTASFSLITTLVKNLSPKISLKKIVMAGAISAILLNFGGNFHTPTYIVKNGVGKYWYPDATRFIGYNPETDDKTIHEFPIYSYVVSDLHAHLINFPFVLLFLALLWNYLDKQKNDKNQIKGLLPLGFVLGIMFMTSAWDFGNYLLVAGVALTLFSIKKKGVNLTAIIDIAKPLGAVIIISVITLLPFLLNFTSIAQGVKLVHTHSPLWQLAILWGFPAILSIAIFSLLIKLKGKFSKPDLFVLSLHIASWGLIIIPEIVFLKDIYISSHYRANTMFKLTYQAFVMFYLSSGYIAIRVILAVKKHSERFFAPLFFATIFSVLMIYPYYATKSYYGELKNYQGLAGDSWLRRELPEQYEIISWFKKNVEGQPVILEAPGDSYTDFNVISAYTGLPTVSGWFVHEWLWRGDSSFPQARVNDITEIYTSTDLQKTKQLLSKYNVNYVIIDSFARQKFPNLNEAKFISLGRRVFGSENTKIYRLTNQQ